MRFFDQILSSSAALNDFMETVIQEIKAQFPGAITEFPATEAYQSLFHDICEGVIKKHAITPQNAPLDHISLLRYGDVRLDGKFTLGEKGFKPWPHQYLTASSIANKFIYQDKRSVVLADSVGAGKTAQALGVFFELKRRGLLTKLVIAAPTTTFSSWTTTLLEFTDTAVSIANTAQEWAALDAASCEIVIINQTMGKSAKVANDGVFYPFFNRNDTLLVLDEAPNLKSMLKNIVAATNTRKLYLSGTIVTSTVFDILDYFDSIPYYVKDSWKKRLSRTFTKKLPAIISEESIDTGYLAWLNMAALISDIYLRPRELLALNIPRFTVTFQNSSEPTNHAVEFRSNFSPRQLITSTGVSSGLTQRDRSDFTKAQHFSLEFFEHTKQIIQSAKPGSGVLIICASEKDIKLLEAELKIELPEHKTFRIKHKKLNDSLTPTDPANIYLTTQAYVEGFNIHKRTPNGLLKIIFMGATASANDFEQGIGRAVRPYASLPEEAVVEIHMLLKPEHREFVTQTLDSTIKGKYLLSCINISSALSFYMLSNITVQEETAAKKERLQGKKLQHTDEEIQKNIQKAIKSVLLDLNAINAKLPADFIAILTKGASTLTNNPFLFVDFNSYKDGIHDALWDEIETLLNGQLKLKFLETLSTDDLSFIVNQHVVALAFAFNCFHLLVKKFQQKVENPDSITHGNIDDCQEFSDKLATKLLIPKDEYLRIQTTINTRFQVIKTKKQAKPVAQEAERPTQADAFAAQMVMTDPLVLFHGATSHANGVAAASSAAWVDRCLMNDEPDPFAWLYEDLQPTFGTAPMDTVDVTTPPTAAADEPPAPPSKRRKSSHGDSSPPNTAAPLCSGYGSFFLTPQMAPTLANPTEYLPNAALAPKDEAPPAPRPGSKNL